MNKILLINIDEPHRSLYSVQAIALLREQHPLAQITIIVSKGCEAIENNRLCNPIHFIDVEKFFQDTSNFSNDSLEKEIKRLLTPVINDYWDLIINLSFNALGSSFVFFLRSKEIMGPHMTHDNQIIDHESFYSFLLSQSLNYQDTCYHYAWLYQNIVSPLATPDLSEFLKSMKSTELNQRMKSIVSAENKKGVVLIDTNIGESRNLTNVHFITDLVKGFKSKGSYVPVLFSQNTEDDSFLIDRLRDSLQGEIYLLDVQQGGHLQIMSSVSCVLTSDFYVKTLADLAGTPSVLLAQGSLPVCDFSILPGSCYVRLDGYSSELSDVISELPEKILSGEPLNNTSNVKVYQTFEHAHLPLMRPEQNCQDEDLARWWLSIRYLSNILNAVPPDMGLNPNTYINSMQKERTQILEGFSMRLSEIKASTNGNYTILVSESDHGVLALGLKFAQFNSGISGPMKAKQALEILHALFKGILEFLSNEEATYSKVVAKSL
ncbi:MAG TPA: hypothetical protein VNJ08_01915 [Bacteriovoracaceae bacterium]|nr:hypothetical protein [Bacteriovoracaceae bacterium]